MIFNASTLRGVVNMSGTNYVSHLIKVIQQYFPIKNSKGQYWDHCFLLSYLDKLVFLNIHDLFLSAEFHQLLSTPIPTLHTHQY